MPEARAVHVGSASLGAWHPETVGRIARNQVFLAARHPAAGHGWPMFVAQSLWTALAFRHGAGIAALRGKSEGLRRFAAMRRDAPPSSAMTQPLANARGSDQSRDCEGAVPRSRH